MKNFMRYMQVIPATMLIVACANQKDPVADLPTIRENAKKQQAAGPQTVTPPAPIKVPVIEEKQVNHEVTLPGPNDLRISAPYPTFTEGVKSTFTYSVLCVLPSCTPTLAIEGLPAGATLTKVANKSASGLNNSAVSTYELSWTPPVQLEKGVISTINVTLRATGVNNIANVQEHSLSVVPAGIDVKDVSVNGLPAEIQEGQKPDFTVTAKISGINPNGASKPTLMISPDSASGIDINGAGFVPAYQLTSPEYDAASSTWKFKLTMDTYNFIPPRKGGDVARANVKFQVCFAGQCSVEKSGKVSIRYAKLAAPAVGGPATPTTDTPAAPVSAKVAKPAPAQKAPAKSTSTGKKSAKASGSPVAPPAPTSLNTSTDATKGKI